MIVISILQGAAKMYKAGGIISIIAGVLGIFAAVFTFFFGGLAGALKTDLLGMRKMLIGLMLLAGALIAGCDNAARNDTRTIGNLVDHLQRSGLSVGGTVSVMAEIVGAAEGARIDVFGQGVEVYRYDMANESQKCRRAFNITQGCALNFTQGL